MQKTCYFINPNPSLSIKSMGSKELGRSYSGGEYKITSSRKLTKDAIIKLWEAGLLGFGQDFSVLSRCDGSEEPAGWHEVEGVMMDKFGTKYDDPPVDWSGRPIKADRQSYYEYITSWRCDSGD